MSVKVSARKCRQEPAGSVSETALNDTRCDLKKVHEFLAQEAVKVGYSHGTKWRCASKSETNANFRTQELEMIDKSVVWVEATITWESGSISTEEVIKLVLHPS